MKRIILAALVDDGGGCLVKKWHAVFLDDSQFSGLKDEEWELEAGDIKRFEDAAKSGELDGREIYGMWIIDRDTEQDNVIKIYSNVPTEIRAFYNAYLERQQ